MTRLLSSSFVALCLVVYAGATPLSTSSDAAVRASYPFRLAPLHVAAHEAPHGLVNNSYIVVFKKDVPLAAFTNHLNFLQAAHADAPLAGMEGGLRHVWDSHLRGYAGMFSDSTLQRIRAMPEVDYVERDQIVRTQDIDTQDTQKAAPWGLARVSHRPRLTFGTFTKYEYEPSGGEGVDVYVIDTGINVDHAEFQGRASWGKTVPENDVDEDNNGHGTHCAGTIASRKYGVAKKANVIAVKVLGSNGSGTMSDVISGVEFAATAALKKDAAARAEFAATGKRKHKGSVANMSLGGGKSPALDQAVNAAVDTGLHFAVAAGNDNRDACSYSPAAAEKAVTVGASTLGDERAYFSNHGPCVDVFAPGLNILSTWIGSGHAVNTISGTSMAAPHTAGMLAYLLSIYPSKTFDPYVDAAAAAAVVPGARDAAQRPLAAAFGGLYELAYGAMPAWGARFLPPPALVRAATDSATDEAEAYATLTPAVLKRALIALASKDLLAELPAGTPNLLIFNNYTRAF